MRYEVNIMTYMFITGGMLIHYESEGVIVKVSGYFAVEKLVIPSKANRVTSVDQSLSHILSLIKR